MPKWYSDIGIPVTELNNWVNDGRPIVYPLDADGRRVLLKIIKVEINKVSTLVLVCRASSRRPIEHICQNQIVHEDVRSFADACPSHGAVFFIYQESRQMPHLIIFVLRRSLERTEEKNTIGIFVYVIVWACFAYRCWNSMTLRGSMSSSNKDVVDGDHVPQ